MRVVRVVDVMEFEPPLLSVVRVVRVVSVGCELGAHIRVRV